MNTLRNPHLNPSVLAVLLMGFFALFVGVLYAISPLHRYFTERTVSVPVEKVFWVTKSSPKQRPLPPEQCHWAFAVHLQGSAGQDRTSVFDCRSDEPKPEFTTVALRVTDDKFPTCRRADPVTLWGEGQLVFIATPLLVIFLIVAFSINLRRWQRAEQALDALRSGELSDEEASVQVVLTVFD